VPIGSGSLLPGDRAGHWLFLCTHTIYFYPVKPNRTYVNRKRPNAVTSAYKMAGENKKLHSLHCMPWIFADTFWNSYWNTELKDTNKSHHFYVTGRLSK